MGVINWEQFNENFQYYDKSIITEVIAIFFDEYDERIANLQKNINENDLTALAFNAHSLKSVISNYMAPSTLELTRKLEEMAKNNSADGIPELFLQLKSSTHELLVELKQYVESLE
jgi:HPt (histidine-containing phosphotransfer) domain-containing protein